jgi:hypothetical protein
VAYIPSDAHWYVAELVQEITVEGDSRNVIHKKLMLIRADGPDQAYEKAVKLGRESENSYENPEGRKVQFRFRGLSELMVVYDEISDGAELLYEQKVGVPNEQIERWIQPKERLSSFRSIEVSDGPDYSSKEIMNDVRRLIGSS